MEQRIKIPSKIQFKNSITQGTIEGDYLDNYNSAYITTRKENLETERWDLESSWREQLQGLLENDTLKA